MIFHLILCLHNYVKKNRYHDTMVEGMEEKTKSVKTQFCNSCVLLAQLSLTLRWPRHDLHCVSPSLHSVSFSIHQLRLSFGKSVHKSSN